MPLAVAVADLVNHSGKCYEMEPMLLGIAAAL